MFENLTFAESYMLRNKLKNSAQVAWTASFNASRHAETEPLIWEYALIANESEDLANDVWVPCH